MIKEEIPHSAAYLFISQGQHIGGLFVMDKLMQRSGYQKRVITLIVLFALVRFIPASVLELGNDEAYYWVYSRQLQWNYFDHPPMVAVWIRLFTLNGWLDNYEAVVRAGSIFSCAFSTWFLYKAVSLIKDERTGWFAAILFNASLYTGIVAGVLVMPDSPQLFFWTLCLWQMAKLTRNDNDKLTWLLIAISAGLAVMSKVHGVFLWAGLGMFILIKKREWLKKPILYVSLLISLAIVSPIWWWNLHYDFVTWQFHSARVDISVTDQKDGFWQESFQQILVNNPINFLLIVAALLFALKKRRLHPALVINNYIALPFILLLLVISIFRDIWFHWSGPAFTTLLPLAAVRLSEINTHSVFPRWLKWSTAVSIVVLLAWPGIIHYYPGTYGSKETKSLGMGDVTLDKYGWKDAGEHFSVLYKKEVEEKGLSPQTPVVCDTWWGAHLEYYFAKPADAPVIGLGSVYALHQYNWLNEKRIPDADMDTAYCIISTIEDTVSSGLYDQYYYKDELLTTIPVYRSGKAVASFHVRRLTGWKGYTYHPAQFTAASD